MEAAGNPQNESMSKIWRKYVTPESQEITFSNWIKVEKLRAEDAGFDIDNKRLFEAFVKMNYGNNGSAAWYNKSTTEYLKKIGLKENNMKNETHANFNLGNVLNDIKGYTSDVKDIAGNLGGAASNVGIGTGGAATNVPTPADVKKIEDAKPEKKSKAVWWIVGGVVVVAIAGVIIWQVNKHKGGKK